MKNELKRQRDDELYRSYLKVSEGRDISFREAVRLAVDGGASRYYFPSDYVLRRLRAMEKGVTKFRGFTGNENRKEMYEDLFRRYKLMLEAVHIPRKYIVEELLEMPAPSFYLNYRYAERVIIAKRREAKVWQRKLKVES